ncbi:LuxR family two component transcriptional regulator [Alteromonadaceae bacterium 2753L.S.0a.02]|nr:LuxR family two component transcriptional regulator [Alteromonadaceae bacterium 2753L.S.0a.02]
MSKTKISIVIVEDDTGIRQQLIDTINGDNKFQLKESCANYQAGLEALESHKPDVLLVDLGLPDGSGADLIAHIYKKRFDTQAIVLSGFQDETVVFKALEAGAQGYILKQDSKQYILGAIEQMLAGGSPISPVIARLLLQKFNRPDCSNLLPETLTERQISILKYVSQGFSSAEIAEKLGLSYHTVTTHIKNIYNKLQVNSRTEALYEARRLGLL